MSFLGILNLSTEDEVRPEEQASVVQVRPKAFLSFKILFIDFPSVFNHRPPVKPFALSRWCLKKIFLSLETT